ncbi:hypothetical protein CLPU_27c00040 [Gottschalkia purinilytica]|uniref:DUF3793 family protein n=1 Tax=Gottschalkia purinilytica TaxID=1503 RepID=A0A0L0W6F4_GOTPU|nr:DUF3793 family protein [Gottschalkia purinilytica]KNF07066.1 hypothetical protein CLPU_27c00040 [Gottschalkia purinilytica]
MEDLKINFFRKLNSMSEIEYMEHFITYLISPVITGIKPSSTITLSNSTKNIYEIWNLYGEKFLNKFGLESLVLKKFPEGAVILIYNRKVLEQHIFINENKEFLCELGYGKDLTLKDCLLCLKHKFEQVSFPHESGIFLGIPINDVKGFINNRNCLLCGYWKVYDDCEKAKEIFKLYDKSKEIILTNILKGENLELMIKSISNIYTDQLRYIS